MNYVGDRAGFLQHHRMGLNCISLDEVWYGLGFPLFTEVQRRLPAQQPPPDGLPDLSTVSPALTVWRDIDIEPRAC